MLQRSLTIFWLAARILTQLTWLMTTARFRGRMAQKRAEEQAFARWGRMLRVAALELQGLIIKACQFVTTRGDVLPEALTRELADLTDRVPGVSFDLVKKSLESELQAPLDTVFVSFDPQPIAAASLGQVHRAVLRAGDAVAVKVLRPGIERILAVDFAALRKVFRAVSLFASVRRHVDLLALLDELNEVTYREIDYRLEAAHIRRFQANFAGVPGIASPRLYGEWMTPRMLVLEHVEGTRLSDRAALAEDGTDPAVLADRLLDAYVKQFLVDGFVHVDPHPGNFLIQGDGTIIFLDFGLVFDLSPSDRRSIASVASGLVSGELEQVIDGLANLGFIPRHRDRMEFRRTLAILTEQLAGMKIEPGQAFDGAMLAAQNRLAESELRLPTKYVYLLRGLGLLVGLVGTLNPDIIWKDVLKEKILPAINQNALPPWAGRVQEWLGPEVAAAAVMAGDQAKALALTLLRLPRRLDRTLAEIEEGRLQVRLDETSLAPVARHLAQHVSGLAWMVLAAGAGVSGTLLRVGGFPAEARVAWGVGAVAICFGLVALWWHPRR